MGSVCCCLHVELPQQSSNESTHGVCKCPRCFFNTFFSKYAKAKTEESSSNGATAILDPNIATPNNAQNETITTRSITLPVDANQSVADQLQKAPEQQIRSRQVEEEQNSDQYSSVSLNSPSQERLEARDPYIYTSADDEDVCPTCLEEYEPENPKIVTACNHHYHLGCIYAWMERSQTCPICSKVMEFSEQV